MNISESRITDTEFAAISSLLLQEWDPIGIAEVPEAADEYDDYAMRIVTMLESGATAAVIAEYLKRIVTEEMMLCANAVREQKIAVTAVAIHADHTRNLDD